ncbi:hypothetical protein HMPREF0183_1975 [Brevibacterium mcbrellneri ATCC 49030]|uniref:Uncharacterized protein n=1 Tax=Brevibacterium mcbrellneri ATCC 49030 TaxID=585530 RepID=D4YPW5_9MICO|nr:hypothetical protein [Brevibacterium mcbrellneri]EFG46745.1 hypothetical protein HMPREF0183_1975 [Brevibacterium mcbrellneri ATCC 49030]
MPFSTVLGISSDRPLEQRTTPQWGGVGRVAGVARQAALAASDDLVTGLDIDAAQVTYHGAAVVAVIDDDLVAVAIAVPPRGADDAGAGGQQARTEVDGVLVVGAERRVGGVAAPARVAGERALGDRVGGAVGERQEELAGEGILVVLLRLGRRGGLRRPGRLGWRIGAGGDTLQRAVRAGVDPPVGDVATARDAIPQVRAPQRPSTQSPCTWHSMATRSPGRSQLTRVPVRGSEFMARE